MFINKLLDLMNEVSPIPVDVSVKDVGDGFEFKWEMNVEGTEVVFTDKLSRELYESYDVTQFRSMMSDCRRDLRQCVTEVYNDMWGS